MIDLRHVDCMEYLATCEDNAFELAIVDPPYGIGAGKMKLGKAKKKNGKVVFGTVRPRQKSIGTSCTEFQKTWWHGEPITSRNIYHRLVGGFFGTK